MEAGRELRIGRHFAQRTERKVWVESPDPDKIENPVGSGGSPYPGDEDTVSFSAGIGQAAIDCCLPDHRNKQPQQK
jgi:hypothetical protein